ncbi:tetratricopeptide repeat protein, partial [Actinomadura roseirufa]|uniref:tetratricopeptide repeat protein n=1 Tax=Actinomadura roseirufa TaxID=2094049 RepID=UPI001041A86F
DPRTLALQANLAAVHRDLGDLPEAERLLREAFERARADLGVEHPATLVPQAGLAAVLVDLGRPDEAAALLLRVHEIRARRLGPAHPATLRAGTGLGHLYLRGGEPRRAAALFERVLTEDAASNAGAEIVASARAGLARAREEGA